MKILNALPAEAARGRYEHYFIGLPLLLFLNYMEKRDCAKASRSFAPAEYRVK